MNSLLTLHRRGFIKQFTHEEELKKTISSQSLVFYVGVDPTGSSLHIGHLVPILASLHLALAGHKPIFLLGGGTALIGDPSGKDEMRSLQAVEKINKQADQIKLQLESLMKSFGISEYSILNNANWLNNLEYLSFLREIGRHFSVNRMLSFETYKRRFEKGLSFIEFNYQLLQAYDFLTLFDRYGCLLQLGGDDQWGNIVSGIDLIRRMRQKETYGLTFNLVTRSDGKKMGKTEKGAIFLDASLTSVYDMYQYWRNIDDADIQKFLLLYTFLDESKIEKLTKVEGSLMNKAKEVLAFEATKLIHGEKLAKEAQDMATGLFKNLDLSNLKAPSVEIPRKDLSQKMNILDFCVMIGLTHSKGEARRIILGGGLYFDGVRVDSFEAEILSSLLLQESVLVRQGKKKFIKVLFT